MYDWEFTSFVKVVFNSVVCADLLKRDPDNELSSLYLNISWYNPDIVKQSETPL